MSHSVSLHNDVHPDGIRHVIGVVIDHTVDVSHLVTRQPYGIIRTLCDRPAIGKIMHTGTGDSSDLAWMLLSTRCDTCDSRLDAPAPRTPTQEDGNDAPD